MMVAVIESSGDIRVYCVKKKKDIRMINKKTAYEKNISRIEANIDKFTQNKSEVDNLILLVGRLSNFIKE